MRTLEVMQTILNIVVIAAFVYFAGRYSIAILTDEFSYAAEEQEPAEEVRPTEAPEKTLIEIRENALEEVAKPFEIIKESTADQVSSQEEPAELEPEEVEESTDMEYLGTYTLTAYCGCEQCCGQWASSGTIIGSGGVPLIQGVHCASPLKNGTVVMIEDYGIYEVQDSTSQWIADYYGGKIIDIYFDDHNDALKFGKRTAEVYKVY